jgi:membrane protein
MAGWFGRIRSAASTHWTWWKERYEWLRHVVSAWNRMQRNNGNQYAAAITYFSFLALFPLLLLAVSIAGFVLHAHPSTEQSLFAHVSDKVPGALGGTINKSIRTAIANRSGVGIVGLVGVLLTGLGWIGNLRAAINAVWGAPRVSVNFFKAKLADLLVLAGLGLGLIISLALTVIGTSLTDQILRALGLDSMPGSHAVLKVLGIAIAVAGDLIIFLWLLVRLPQVEATPRIAFKGALLASVGFEVLKIVGSYTIAHTANSPTAGPFAGIIAVLVWIQLVARLMLFCCAWMATLCADERAAVAANRLPVTEPERMLDGAGAPVGGPSPAAVGATLLGAGALAGAIATWAVTHSRPGPRL